MGDEARDHFLGLHFVASNDARESRRYKVI
jgi:hypothetical protein